MKQENYYRNISRAAIWREEARTNQTRRKTEEVTSDEWVTTRGAQRIGGNSLVLRQVNCRSILSKSLEFWNLVDTCNPDRYRVMA
jgi:hypothetical protein